MEGRIKLGKRLCAWMLSFALLFGLAPGVVIRAEAEENEYSLIGIGAWEAGWGQYANQEKTDVTVTNGNNENQLVLTIPSTNYVTSDSYHTYRASIGFNDGGSMGSNSPAGITNGSLTFTYSKATSNNSGEIKVPSSLNINLILTVTANNTNTNYEQELAVNDFNAEGSASYSLSFTDFKKDGANIPSDQKISGVTMIISSNSDFNGTFTFSELKLWRAVSSSVASTALAWTFDNDNEGWKQGNNDASVWSNGTIESTISVRADEWNESVAAYLANGDGIATTGGDVTFDIIYNASDKETLEELSTRVVYKYGNWNSVEANAQPLAAGNALSGNEYYYQRVTVSADSFQKEQYTSAEQFQPVMLQIGIIGDTGLPAFSGTIWLDNIAIGDVSDLPNRPDVPVAAETGPTTTGGPWADNTTDGHITNTTVQNYSDGSVVVGFTAQSGSSWPTMSIHETNGQRTTNAGNATLTFWAKASGDASLYFEAVYGGNKANDDTKNLTITGQKITIALSDCTAVTNGNLTLNIKPPETLESDKAYQITLYDFNLSVTGSGSGEGGGGGQDDNPTTYAVTFTTAPSDASIPLSVFTVGSNAVTTSPIRVNQDSNLSFTVADTYHNTGTGDYYKLQSVTGADNPGSDGKYTVNDAASITATYAKMLWKCQNDGGDKVQNLSLTEDGSGVPTISFNETGDAWGSVKMWREFTPEAEKKAIALTLKNNNNQEVSNLILTTKLGNDKIGEVSNVSIPANSSKTIIFPAESAFTDNATDFTLVINPGVAETVNLTVTDIQCVTPYTLTVSNPVYYWGSVITVNGVAVSTNDENNPQGSAGVIAGTDAILKMKNSDSYYVKRVTVDGKVVNIGTAQDDVYTYTLENVSADHTIVVTYEYSGTSITPEEPAVDTTEINTTTDNGTSTATVNEDAADEVTSALTNNKAAGITATEADNVALEAAVVTALATNESNKGDDGIVAVITTKSAVVEAPAAMFENAKDGSAAIAVTLKTKSKNAGSAASDDTIKNAVGEGNTSSVKGALEISLEKTSGEEIEVKLEANAAKPITIRTTIAGDLDKNQLHVGYIKNGKLVYDDTVQLLDYSKTGGVSFTTTHYTTFVFVNGDPVWNFNSGLDGWSFGWANDYDGIATGHSYTDEQKAKMVSLSDGALKLSLDYTKTPSKENPWPSFTVQHSGETIPLSGKNYLSMDVYYDAGALGGSTLLFAVGASNGESKLITADTADTAQLNTYAATDATINGKTMKKTRVLIGFKNNVSDDGTSMNIDIVNTSGTYKGDVYLDNITIGTASHFITTSINEDYRGAFIPGGRVPMLGDSTTIYVVQKGSDQRIAKLTLDGNTVSGASGKTTYQFTCENDAADHTLIADFEWFDANGSAGLVVSSGEVFRAELTNPVAAVDEKLVQPEATVKNGTLTAAINEKKISDIIAEVETAEKTDVITIIPYVKDRKTEVTRTEVALPAASVSELAEKTGAALRVETVVAAITIPNESLKEIGSKGGIIAVAAERAEEYMELSVTANGSRLTDIRGGISASVPMECGPGTVAMLAEDELRTRSELVNRSAGHGSEADPVEKDHPTESVEGKPLLYSAANIQGTAMTVLLPGSARIRFVHQAKRFTDVPEVSWASGAVDFVSSHRIFGGYDDGAFYPNSVMNRAMLVQVLYNMSERPAVEHGSVFADVPSGAWFADAVNWASGKRVVRGYGDGTFAPGATITRQDAVVILYRYAEEPECEDTDLSRFEDEDRIGTYARKAIQWAVSRRLLNGVSASQLAPGAELTRYQAAKLLMNYVQDRVG